MRPNHFSNCHRIGLMIVVAGVLLSLRPAAASAEEAVGGDKCTPSYKPASNVSQDSRTSLALPAELIKTQLVPEKSLYHYRFRLTRHPGALPVAFKSSMTLPSRSPRDPIRVVADLSNENSVFVNQALAPSSTLSGGELLVLLCIDPEKVPPGSYTGSVRIDDPRLPSATASFTVSLQYQQWWLLAFGYGTLLVVVGTLVVWLGTLRARNLPLNSVQLHKDLGEFVRLNVYGVLLGITAAFTVWRTQYLADEKWAGTLSEHLALLGAIGPAYIGAVATGAVYTGRQVESQVAIEADPSQAFAADPPRRPVLRRPRRYIVIGIALLGLVAAFISAGTLFHPVVRTQTQSAPSRPLTGEAVVTNVPNVYNANADEARTRLEQAHLVVFAYTVCSGSVVQGHVRQVLSSDGKVVIDKAGVLIRQLPVGSTVEVKVGSGTACQAAPRRSD